MALEKVIHPIPPLWNENSRVLILGSFPSVKSREQAFFYGHPQNRFWRVMAGLLQAQVPTTVEEKKALLLTHRIAVWDVVASCEIEGSSDSSMRNVVANDLSPILEGSRIQKLFLNGKTAEKFYKRYIFPKLQREATVLPSTSPANAAWSLERLMDAWKVVIDL